MYQYQRPPHRSQQTVLNANPNSANMTANIYRNQNSTDMGTREMEEIMNRRARMEERTERILDAKTRQFGVDTQALGQQVAERREREALEIERSNRYDANANNIAATLQDLENEKRAMIRADHMAANNYRKQQARERTRRELTAKANADNYVDTNTNFLKFTGEDLGKDERERGQKVMQRDWLGQQMAMLQDKTQFDAAEQANYEAQQAHISELRRAAENDASIERKLRNLEQAQANKRMAEIKRAKEQAWTEEQQALNKNEIVGQLNSQFLNEGVSEFAGPSGFKGFTTAQRQRILDEQAMQMAEAAAVREVQYGEEIAYDQYQETIRQQVVGMDQQRAMDEKTERMRLRNSQALQAREKNARYDYLDKVVYTNPVQESYFQQFQQGSR